MSFYLKVSIAVVVLVLVALGVILICSGGEENKKVEAELRAAFEAARKGDVQGVIDHVSPNFNTDGLRYADACATLRGFVKPGNYKDLELHDLEISVFGDSASAKCNVRVVEPAGAQGFSYTKHLDLGLKKEGGRWLVTSASSPQPGPW